VGYRTRLDTKISAQTRIEVVTEGILTRMLQNDAALESSHSSSSMNFTSAICKPIWVWPCAWMRRVACAKT